MKAWRSIESTQTSRDHMKQTIMLLSPDEEAPMVIDNALVVPGKSDKLPLACIGLSLTFDTLMKTLVEVMDPSPN